MSVRYRITSGDDAEQTTLIFSDGTIETIVSSHPQYDKIVSKLRAGNTEENEIASLARPTLSVGRELVELSDRIVYSNNRIFFDGDVLDNSLSKHIVRILEEGGGRERYSAFVNFLEKLYTNPNEASRNSLYEFIVSHNITIMPDGDFIAYKGVNSDGTSRNSGYGIVDGEVFESAHLPNHPGAVVSIPRSMVDANTSVGCSVGLHAGTYDYASKFSRGLLLIVKINPRDVVSVPEDCDFQKIRTCRYVVISEINLKIEQTTYSFASDDDTYIDEFEDEDEDEDAYDRATANKSYNNASTHVDRSFENHPSNRLTEDQKAFYEGTIKAIDSEEGCLLTFDYFKPYSERQSIYDFEVTSVTTQYRDLLLHGVRSDGEYRSYKYSRMDDIVAGYPVNDEERKAIINASVEDDDEDAVNPIIELPVREIPENTVLMHTESGIPFLVETAPASAEKVVADTEIEEEREEISPATSSFRPGSLLDRLVRSGQEAHNSLNKPKDKKNS